MDAQVCGEPIGSPVFVYEAIDETGPMIGQEIHIVDCGNDTGAEISIPDDLSEAEVLIHDDIAAETVVRTTNVYHKPFLKDDSGDSGCSMEALEEEARFMDSQSSDCGLGELGCDIDTLHPPYGTPTWSSQEICRVEDLSSSAGFVALVPDTILQGETTHSREASVREMAKREQDRLKKKKLRSNPAYRQMEKDKARARMKLRRLDPVFRSNERQRDKQRRKAARVRDIAKRIKEKERDKEHKRQKRVEAGAVLWTAEGFEDSYNSVVESIIGKHNTLENVTTQPRETFDGT